MSLKITADSESHDIIDNSNKQSTIDETYSEILNKSSSITSSSEGLFAIWHWLRVVTSELCSIYWADKTAEYLQWYMNNGETWKGELGNLFDFISFIEPNKKERIELYNKLSEQSLENIVHNEKNTDWYFDDRYPASYKLDLSWIISEWKNLDTVLWKISNFKNIGDFRFHTSHLEEFWFYEKLWKSDWNVIKLLNELRAVFVDEEEVKLWREIEPLLVKLEQRLMSLKEKLHQIDLNLLNSASKSRDDFNANFSLENNEELDDLVRSWIEAFKNNIVNLQKSADDMKNIIEQDMQDLNEKKSSLLHIR